MFIRTLLLTGSVLGFACCAHCQPADTIRRIATQYLDKALGRNTKFCRMISTHDGRLLQVQVMERVIAQSKTGKLPSCYMAQVFSGGDINQNDTTWFEKNTLRPIAYREFQGGSLAAACYVSGDRIANSIYSGKERKENYYPLRGNTYFMTMQEQIITELPLKLGFTAVIKAINPGQYFKESIIKLKVLALETIDYGGTQINAWKVSVDNSFVIINQWYSVKEHELLKESFEAGNQRIVVYALPR